MIAFERESRCEIGRTTAARDFRSGVDYFEQGGSTNRRAVSSHDCRNGSGR